MEKNRGGEAEERGRRGYGWRDPRSRGTRKEEEEEEEEDDDDDDDDDDTGSRVRSRKNGSRQWLFWLLE